ncbi:phosphoglycerate mutase-like protein [Multifurca ochricompacta]|uniref:Phosphoglycerate mutase-like protein n=1 Tax=Multifurca ochricompacta TaxID=376703 RepID=A0AAD4QRZ3_9AGAM|nr:phosphoglycerate mutase-like protein [Multifurca ochricompacta]
MSQGKIHGTSMETVQVYIVRHGETEENRRKIIQGQLDTPLNLEGEKQADLVARALKDVPFNTCYSSDLRRAASTAERILVHHPKVKLQREIALRERYMGDLQGRVWGDFQGLITDKGDRKEREIREPESPEAVMKRAMTWWNETVVGTNASFILVVSHGAWIRLLVQGLLGDKAIRAVHGITVGRCLNTGVSVIEIPRVVKGRGNLLQFGNVMHLSGPSAGAGAGCGCG